jgi:hypothetical protein
MDQMTYDEAARLLAFQAKLVAAQYELQAMVAENQRRIAFDQSVSYPEETFHGVMERYRLFPEQVAEDLHIGKGEGWTNGENR